MTPTSTSAPTMMNSPMKNTRVGHSTSSRYSGGSRLGHCDQRTRAEQRDQGGLDVQRRVGDEADHHASQHDHGPDAAATRSRDHLALVERHHLRDPLLVVGERGAEHEPAHADEYDQQDDDDRCEVDQEVVERQVRRGLR